MTINDAAPIVGTKAADVLTVDTSTSFTWMPDPGNSFSGSQSIYNFDTFEFVTSTSNRPSEATGRVTFDRPSSMPFSGAEASDFAFQFTQYGSADIYGLRYSGSNFWSWNPQTGVLDPAGTEVYPGYTFNSGSASMFEFRTLGQLSAVDLGHWELVANPINTEVFGGAGNDTIYGGQGIELLSGDAGDDTIYVGRGEDTVFGGSGNDTIWGGIGRQLLIGDTGNDVVHAGLGDMSLLGGDGKDTLYGGHGTDYLSGGSGADWLHAGIGNETLEGGSGRDTFAFVNGVSGKDLITDFHIGIDTMQVAAGINGLAVSNVRDLASHITAGPGDSAVVNLGAASVTLLGLSLNQVETHLQQVFRIA